MYLGGSRLPPFLQILGHREGYHDVMVHQFERGVALVVRWKLGVVQEHYQIREGQAKS
jgi:hypothetical protein